MKSGSKRKSCRPVCYSMNLNLIQSLFDPDLMRQNMLDLLESSISSQAEEDKVDSNSESVLDLDEEAHETIGERFVRRYYRT